MSASGRPKALPSCYSRIRETSDEEWALTFGGDDDWMARAERRAFTMVINRPTGMDVPVELRENAALVARMVTRTGWGHSTEVPAPLLTMNSFARLSYEDPDLAGGLLDFFDSALSATQGIIDADPAWSEYSLKWDGGKRDVNYLIEFGGLSSHAVRTNSRLGNVDPAMASVHEWTPAEVNAAPLGVFCRHRIVERAYLANGMTPPREWGVDPVLPPLTPGFRRRIAAMAAYTSITPLAELVCKYTRHNMELLRRHGLRKRDVLKYTSDDIANGTDRSIRVISAVIDALRADDTLGFDATGLDLAAIDPDLPPELIVEDIIDGAYDAHGGKTK